MTVRVLYEDALTYEARLDRVLLSLHTTMGVRRGFKVTQRAAGANYSVEVSAGVAVVKGTVIADDGHYLVLSDATESVSIDPPTAGKYRRDRVVVEVRDADAGGVGGYSDARVTVVRGTDAATPAAAVMPATPANALTLAEVYVNMTAASILPGNISDLRVWALPRRGLGSIEALMIPEARVPLGDGPELANGQAVSRTTYAEYWSAVGTKFGAGNGSSTFNLPNLIGRVVFGADGVGGVTANLVPGTAGYGVTGGHVTVDLTEANLPTVSGRVTADSGTHHGHLGRLGKIAQAVPSAGIEGLMLKSPATLGAQGSPVQFDDATDTGGGDHSHPFSFGHANPDGVDVMSPYMTATVVVWVA